MRTLIRRLTTTIAMLACIVVLPAVSAADVPGTDNGCDVRTGAPLSAVTYAYMLDALEGRRWDVTFDWTVDDEGGERTITLAWTSDAWSGEAVWTADPTRPTCNPENSAATQISRWLDGQSGWQLFDTMPTSLDRDDIDPDEQSNEFAAAVHRVLEHGDWLDAIGGAVGAHGDSYSFDEWASERFDENTILVHFRYDVAGDPKAVSWAVTEDAVLPASSQSALLSALLYEGSTGPSYDADHDYAAAFEPLPNTLDRDAIASVMRAAGSDLQTCAAEFAESGEIVELAFAIHGDGSALSEIGDEGEAPCAGAIAALSFPNFAGEPIPIRYPVHVP